VTFHGPCKKCTAQGFVQAHCPGCWAEPEPARG